ncbi:hypothetical protein K0M31_008793 [Melipona bicolor]|uniref:Uncharacterized protein n=1 Tax=Melipona bicolor TaxID=60889 RepID=A0AA40FQI2_9HYME|nr:hypothetical protein K0M31_008793 [Melipona bicolor]
MEEGNERRETAGAWNRNCDLLKKAGNESENVLRIVGNSVEEMSVSLLKLLHDSDDNNRTWAESNMCELRKGTSPGIMMRHAEKFMELANEQLAEHLNS